MKTLLAIAALAALAACATAGSGERVDWRCDNGAAYSARTTPGGVDVFAGGRVYSLRASGASFSDGTVTYSGNGQLSGAFGGPYSNCRRG